MIELRRITKDYRSDMLRRKRRILRSVSLNVAEGETYALLGANGAGKTTTMKVLLDLIRPSSGEAFIGGRPVSDPGSRKSLGYLPEHPYFLGHLSGPELIRYYGRLSGLSKAVASERAEILVNRVGLDPAGNRKIRTFSKGMKQRLGFAQLLVAQPEVIILDEPLSGLDPVGRRDMRILIEEQKELGRTILLSSHILEDVEKVCDRAGFLVGGQLRNEVVTGITENYEILVTGMTPESIDAGHIADSIVEAGRNIQIALREEGDLHRIQSAVLREGGTILSVAKKQKSLEKLFVENVLPYEKETK